MQIEYLPIKKHSQWINRKIENYRRIFEKIFRKNSRCSIFLKEFSNFCVNTFGHSVKFSPCNFFDFFYCVCVSFYKNADSAILFSIKPKELKIACEYCERLLQLLMLNFQMNGLRYFSKFLKNSRNNCGRNVPRAENLSIKDTQWRKTFPIAIPIPIKFTKKKMVDISQEFSKNILSIYTEIAGGIPKRPTVYFS